MSKLAEFLRQYQDPILLLLLAGGFAVVLGELVLYQHWVGVQLIGFISTVVGLIAVLAGLFVKGTLRVVTALLLVVLSLAGVIGTYQHYESNSGEATRRTELVETTGVSNQPIAYLGGDARATTQDDDLAESREAGDRGETTPPPLAPLSLAGLSLMGAVILLAKQDVRTV